MLAVENTNHLSGDNVKSTLDKISKKNRKEKKKNGKLETGKFFEQKNAEYLHYHNVNRALFEVKTNQTLKIIEKQKKDFINRFKKLNNGAKGFGDKKIADILDEFVYIGGTGNQKGDLGAEIVKRLETQMQGLQTSGGMKFTTKDGVGGNDKEVIYLSQASRFFQAKSRFIEEAKAITERINQSVDTMAQTLAQNGEDMLAAMVLQTYYSGKELTEKEQAFLGGRHIDLSQEELDKSVKHAQTTLKTMSESIEAMNQLAKSATSSKKDELDNNKTTLQSYVRSIGRSLNTVVSFAHEVAGAYCFSQADQEIQRSQTELEDAIKDMAARSNGDMFYTSTWDGAKHLSDEDKKETKDDIRVAWNKNGITLSFGVSFKMRQGQGFRDIANRNNLNFLVSGFIARDETYSTLAKKAERYYPGITQIGYENIGAQYINNSSKNDAELWKEWEQIAEILGLLCIVDAIAGKGQQKGDFSGLLVVNTRIFSVYDILERICEQIKNPIQGSKSMFKMAPLRKDIQLKISSKIESDTGEKILEDKSGNLFKKALYRNMYTYDMLAKAKIDIGLNLGALYGSRIFNK